MNRKIIGVTVGTPISPRKIEEKIKPVKTVNGIAPDENGNVVVEAADNKKTLNYSAGDGLVAIPEGATEVTVTGTCSGYLSSGAVYFVLVDNFRNIIDYSHIGSGDDTKILDVSATLDIPDNAVYFGTHPFIDGQYNDSRNEGYYCNLSAAFNIVAKGKDGITPHIGNNGNWWIGETDTGVKAEGKDGKDGADGADGKNGEDGKDGAKGADGKTPYIQNGYWYIDGVNTGVKAEGKDGANGTDGEDGKDGTNGKDGANGVDGVSPTISVSNITGGHRITITDKNETKYVDIMDGSDGADGKDGADGSKGADGRGIKTVARTSGTGAAGTTDIYTITYTDNTTSTFTVYNGKNGADGKSIDRISYMASGTDSAGRVVHHYDVFVDDTSIGGFAVTDGKDGADGKNGTNGTNGKDGADGKDGTSVTVTNVTESPADGGSNVVTFSDGKTLTVKNGSKGSKGDPYTLTDSDKQTIVNAVIAALPKYAGEVS